ncbi:MAG: methionyl-tRNA formyltransferase [Methylobacter sp.]|nr:MAG: methionyl-tRNA formyltransferase [Methylobacter sp.]PPD23983.1 MAG: methionyl-tRNA formyltransferase [Methylobacter sp.]PPD32432.1 MAG: methionyl-tRNA formyltransferase [Methylomonas sp.]
MRVIFAGTPEFAVPVLQMLINSEHDVCAVYTQPDRPAGRGRKLAPSPVKVLAESSGIPVHQPENFKAPDDLAQLAALNADLMVVVAYGLILSQTVLDTPKLGCINVHASLLPRWRGAAPIQRAIMAGDEKTGVTIMRMVRQLDAGDMLHKEVCDIGAGESASELHDRLSQLGALGLAKVLPTIEAGAADGEKQDESLVTYAEKLAKAEAVIDWSLPAEVLARKVRGLNAWPVAQTLHRDQVLRIWQAEAVAGNNRLPPGTVVEAGKHLDVATGQGLLRLLEVQLPGGKRLPATAFLSAHAMHNAKLG